MKNTLGFLFAFGGAMAAGLYSPTHLHQMAEGDVYEIDTLPGWGYNYQQLKTDLALWGQSPFVQVESLGQSVDGRGIWALEISDFNDPEQKVGVSLHNRTHPLEVQSGWVLNEMVRMLLADSPFADSLRKSMHFYIVPMLNPDGVERMEDCAGVGFGRCNANGIDLEGEWDEAPANMQPEVQVLQEYFLRNMGSDTPYKIALNMHSAFGCQRFFWYHEEGGTSAEYTFLERSFIDLVQSFYPEGISPWYTKTSWSTSTPIQYPESWFWLNYGEKVLALTYEHTKYCQEDVEVSTRSADALLRGIYAYVTGDSVIVRNQNLGQNSNTFQQLESQSIAVFNSQGKLLYKTNSLTRAEWEMMRQKWGRSGFYVKVGNL